MKKHLSTILAFCFSVTACIYPYTPELDEAPEGILAVDANITIGDVSTVRLGGLYSLYPSEISQSPNFSDAKVWLEDDAGGTYRGDLAYGGNSVYGGYYVDLRAPVFNIDTENAPGDRRYRLFIEALGATYTSDWSDVGEPPVISDIQFLADDENVTVAVSLEGGPDATGYALLSFDETWRFHVDYIPQYTVTPRIDWSGNWTISVEDTGPDQSKYFCWRSLDNQRTYPVDYTSMTGAGVTNWPLHKPRPLSLSSVIYSLRHKNIDIVLCLVTQSCPTPCNPMDCSPPDSSVHGILQARILEWVAIPFFRGSS